jgi:energy-coupling factor transporter ATP-binding protein EcfA2
MEITKGKVMKAQKVLIYGPEGIGKSTLASKFPGAIFADVEGSTNQLDVARTKPTPTSWTLLIEQVKYFIAHPEIIGTFITDTADWAEKLCRAHVCAKHQKDSIEEFGYGKGYTYLEEEFGRFLNLLNDLLDRGVNIVLVAHAQMRKFEQPDELGSYDRWELKLEKKTAPLLKEWADMVLFCNYKTYVVNVDNQGAAKGKNKAQGGKRVMYTTHHSCWDAKNRHSLPDEVDFDYSAIAHCIPANPTQITQASSPPPARPAATANTVPQKPAAAPPSPPVSAPAAPPPEDPPPEEPPEAQSGFTEYKGDVPSFDGRRDSPPELESMPLRSLRILMQDNSVSEKDIQLAVANRGYYPIDTPLSKYDQKFVSGVLVGAWDQVHKMIQELKNGKQLKAV